jgi:hypothetical protein
MASFTDNVQALSTFNPYVEQQPIEAMREVGMIKQQQYNQGVQQIQSSIDRVAGLDIMKDVDKKYLQTKLDSLATNLQTVAAGDFSNFQLSNSVAGMATKVGNDSKVQAAVSSTAKVRKQMDIANTAKVAGKSSIQNQWALEQQINSYLQDQNTGSSFNGQYVEYTDIDKKLREVTDKLVVLDSTIDDIYMRNADGSHVKDKNGRPIVDEVMLSVKTKGKPAEKILNNFYSALNENDINQLHIDSSYHYRNASKESLIQIATNNASTKKKMLAQSVVDMSVALDTNPKITAAQRASITANINATTESLERGDVDKYLKSQIEQINTNTGAEEFKYAIYTQQTLTQLADNLSNQTYDKEYKSNPQAQMSMEKKRLQFQYDNANREQSNFMAKLAQDNAHFNATYAQKEREAAMKTMAKTGIPPITAPSRISTDVNKPTLLDVNSDIAGLQGQIRSLNADYGKTITNPALKTAQQKQTYLDYLARTYAEDPSTINRIKDNNVREYLEKRRSLDIQKGQKELLFKATTDATAHLDDKINKSLGSEVGLPHANNGRGYSAKQLYDYSKTVESLYKTVKVGSGSSVGGGGDKTTLDTEALLSKYKGTSLYGMAIATVEKYRGNTLNNNQKVALQRAQDIKMKYDPLIHNIDREKMAIQSQFLAERMPERQTMVGALSKDNKTDMDLVNRLIAMKGRESMMGGVDGMKVSSFDPDVINKLKEDKNINYIIEKKYDGSAVLHVTNGSAAQEVPMNANEFRSYFPSYAKTNPVSDIKHTILSSPNQTTNLKGGHDGSNAVNAYLSGYDVPNLARTKLAHMVRLDVEGDGRNNGSGNDNFQVRMYVNNNGTWVSKILNNEGYVKEGGIQAILDNIGPNTVSEILKK